MDSLNRLVGVAIVDDPPESKLTAEQDDERREESSTDSDDKRREDPSTDTDAGVTYPVRRRFTKPSRVSDEIGSSRATTLTLARPDEYDWKELCKSRPVVAIDAATVGDDGGACSLATSFIFCAMISKPVNTGFAVEGGMTPRAEGAESTTTGDATTRNAMKNGWRWQRRNEKAGSGGTRGQQAAKTMQITHRQEGPNGGLGTVGKATPSGQCCSA